MRNTGATSSDDNHLTHPEDRARLHEAIQRLSRGEATRHTEVLRLRHHDGHLIACQVYLAWIGASGPRGQLLCQLYELPRVTTPAAYNLPTPPDTSPPLATTSPEHLPGGSLLTRGTFHARGNAPSNLRLIYLGAGIASLTELANDDILGNASLLTAQLDSAERQRLRDAFLIAQRDHAPLDLQLYHTTPSGRSRWMHLRAAPSSTPSSEQTLWEGEALDITERSLRTE